MGNNHVFEIHVSIWVRFISVCHSADPKRSHVGRGGRKVRWDVGQTEQTSGEPQRDEERLVAAFRRLVTAAGSGDAINSGGDRKEVSNGHGAII